MDTLFLVWKRRLMLLAGGLLLTACGSDADKIRHRVIAIEGATMGTYYRVQYRESEKCATSQQGLDELLQGFNQSLSTYVADSEISAFNRADEEKWQTLSPRFFLCQAALLVWRESEGAFDVTIGPW